MIAIEATWAAAALGIGSGIVIGAMFMARHYAERRDDWNRLQNVLKKHGWYPTDPDRPVVSDLVELVDQVLAKGSAGPYPRPFGGHPDAPTPHDAVSIERIALRHAYEMLNEIARDCEIPAKYMLRIKRILPAGHSESFEVKP